MEERASTRVAFSHMQLLAGFSVVALFVIVVWQVGQTFAKGNEAYTTNEQTISEQAATPYGGLDWQTPVAEDISAILGVTETPDKDGISNIAGNVVGTLLYSYNTLAENGSYSPEKGEEIAQEIGASLRANVSYQTFSAEDIETDPDTSYERILTYRNDLRVALEPLLKNQGYELSIFANYIDTTDTKHLEQLQDIAKNYRDAIEKSAQITVPTDAVTHHVAVLNALSRFASTIDRMSEHADDAFASVALLRTYTESETSLFTTFDTLASYYTSKVP